MSKKKSNATTPDIDIDSISADSLVARSAAVRLIADRVKKDGEYIRRVRDRVAQRIRYATENQGALKIVHPDKYIFGELIAWADRHWPGKWTDLPKYTDLKISLAIKSNCSMDLNVSHGKPDSVSECHENIDRLSARLADSERQRLAAEQRVLELAPDAEKWRRFRKQNAATARRPRK